MGTHGYRYRVIVFCNRTQKKVLHYCRTLKDAKRKYKKYIEEIKPPFEIMYKKNKRVDFFLGIIDIDNNHKKVYVKDNIGRNVLMDINEKYSILSLKQYHIPEKIYDNKTKKHVDFKDIMTILDNISGVKMIYKINIHLFIETDGDILFYSTKNNEDARRLIDAVIDERIKEGITDCIFARDGDRSHRKYVYERLKEYGYDLRGKIYRHYSR